MKVLGADKAREAVSSVVLDNIAVEPSDIFLDTELSDGENVSVSTILSRLHAAIQKGMDEMGILMGNVSLYSKGEDLIPYTKSDSLTPDKIKELKEGMRDEVIELFDMEGLERKDVHEALVKKYGEDVAPSYSTVCKWIKGFIDNPVPYDVKESNDPDDEGEAVVAEVAEVNMPAPEVDEQETLLEESDESAEPKTPF